MLIFGTIDSSFVPHHLVLAHRRKTLYIPSRVQRRNREEKSNPMKGLIVRWLILTIAIIAASYLIDGIRVSGFLSAFFAAALLGILNAVLRPVLLILTLPVNILTLGLFTFVINALLLKMVSGVVPGFEVVGFWPAILGSLVISLVSWLLNALVGSTGRVEYIDLRKRGDRWE